MPVTLKQGPSKWDFYGKVSFVCVCVRARARGSVCVCVLCLLPSPSDTVDLTRAPTPGGLYVLPASDVQRHVQLEQLPLKDGGSWAPKC